MAHFLVIEHCGVDMEAYREEDGTYRDPGPDAERDIIRGFVEAEDENVARRHRCVRSSDRLQRIAKLE